MEHKEMVAFLQKKVKIIGGISLLTLASVVIVQIARSLEQSKDNPMWGTVASVFIVIACVIAAFLFGHVVHMMFKMFKKS